MRPFRGCKASSTLSTWLGSRAASSSKAAHAQTVEGLGQCGADAHSNSNLGGPVNGGRNSGTFCLNGRGCRPNRRVATFSTGGSGRPPSRKEDPALLLGAGWEGGGEDVTVAVWWDFENCNVPLGIDVYKVGVNIVSGLRMCGFKGPVSISAYGDTLQLSRSTQEALASTGIRLHHIPSGGKDSSDRALLVDLILWTSEHPPPAHLFLISGDRDFSNALHRLRMMNYNILLACPAGTIVSPALLGAATQVWQWNSLVRGEGLLSAIPSPDSWPPDGPSGGGSAPRQTAPKPPNCPSSLHPGLRGPDGNGSPADLGGGKSNPPSVSPLPTFRPKAVPENSISPKGAASFVAALQGSKATEEKRECGDEVKPSSCPASDSVLREVPAEVLQQFRDRLASHLKGIMLADLQAQIATGKLPFEKDFYGHRKIVPFLLSMPHVVRLERVLMKDNRTWSYLLTSAVKSAQTKQKGCNVQADNRIPKTPSKEAERGPLASSVSLKGNQGKPPEVSEVGSSSTEQPPKTSSAEQKIPALQVGIEESANTKQKRCNVTVANQKPSKAVEAGPLAASVFPEGNPEKAPEVSEVGSSATEQPPKTSSAGNKIPAPQVGLEEPIAEVQLNGQSSGTSVQSGKSDHRDVNVVDERAPVPGLYSVFSSLMGKFRVEQKDHTVDDNSTPSPQVASPVADKNGSSDLDQKRMIRPEECSTDFVKVKEREGKSIDSWVVDSKQRSHTDDETSEEKVLAISEEVASRENGGHHREQERSEQSTTSVGKAEREDSEKRSWKTWLWGPTQEKSPPSAVGRSDAGSSVSPAVYDLSDLDKITWKELLSWPQKPTQTSEGGESESSPSSHHAIIDNEGGALTGCNSSSARGGRKLKRGEGSSGHVLEHLKDLKEYLRSPEGTAILSKAPNSMAVVDTLKATGPQNFRGLQSSQIADLVDQLAKAEAAFHDQFCSAPNAHSVAGFDERESILPKGEKTNRKPLSQEEESPNGSRHVASKVMGELPSHQSAEIPSASENGVPMLKQEDRIRSPESDAIPLCDSGSTVSTTPPNETEGSSPALLEFQQWFLETVKEAYKSSERTRRLGFDLSLVKPDFEREFGVRLDPRAYGFVRLQDLIASVSAVRVSRPRHDMCVVHLLKEGESFPEEDQQSGGDTPKVSKWPQMFHDCKSLVRELMLENPNGLAGTKLKPLFISRFQYPLDHKPFGYQIMSDLLRLMPDVVSVNGKYLVPSKELLLSLKDEAREKETSEGALPLEEDNLVDRARSQSEQDTSLEKAGFESLESWGEIDKGGDGSPSPAGDSGDSAPYDDLEPRVGVLEGGESVPSDGDIDASDEEEKSLSTEETETVVLHGSEALEFSTVVLGDCTKGKIEEQTKLAASEGEGQAVERKLEGSLQCLDNMEGGIAAEILPSSPLDTFLDDGHAGLVNAADWGRPQESEVSQNLKTAQGNNEDFNTEKLPEGPIEPDDIGKSLTESLAGDESENSFAEVEGGDFSHVESKTRSLLNEESYKEEGTEAANADGLRESSEEESVLLICDKSSTSMGDDLVTNGTFVRAKQHQQIDGSAVVEHNQALQEGECQTSAIVSPHDDKTPLTAAAETTLEGGKEGESHSGSTSALTTSLKSLWKRMLS